MTLDPHAIRAIVEGEHGDPFAVLGPHRVQTPDGTAVAVRAIVPGAAAVRVLPADAPPTSMVRLHPVGLFEAVLSDRRELFVYRLEVTRNGHITEIDDPYRFPSLLSDFDRHLLAEGTHHRPHHKLGAHPATLDGVTGAGLAGRVRRPLLRELLSIYEVHLGSWRRVPEEGDRFLDYRELADQLADYVGEMGFTHVELLPVMEHPFYGSWGYQTIGYFAPSRRYGGPREVMAFLGHLHPPGVGGLLHWGAAH